MNLVDPKGREMELPVEFWRKELHPSLLSLDVATHYMGFALFDYYDKKNMSLSIYGNVRAERTKAMQYRCCQMTWGVAKILRMFKPAALCMEFPSFQEGNIGQSAARHGDTLWLAFLCGKLSELWGAYMSRVYTMSQGNVSLPDPYLYTFYQWAGQVPKHVTCRRLEELLGIEAMPGSVEDNYADAIMMGVRCRKNEGRDVVMSSGSVRQDVVG